MSKRCMKAPDSLIHCDPDTGEKIDLIPSMVAGAKAFELAQTVPMTVGGVYSLTEGEMVVIQLAATDPTGAPIDWTSAVIKPSLPAGAIGPDTNGAIQYTAPSGAAAESPFSFDFCLSNVNGVSNTSTIQISVDPVPNAPPTIGATIPDQSDVENVAATNLETIGFFADSDGTIASIEAVGLPDGLVIDPATGVISGTPVAGAATAGLNSDGVYQVILTATDNNGATVMSSFNWTVTEVAVSNFFETGDAGESSNQNAIQDAIDNGTPIMINGTVYETPTLADLATEISAAGGTQDPADPYSWTGAANIETCTVTNIACAFENITRTTDITLQVDPADIGEHAVGDTVNRLHLSGAADFDYTLDGVTYAVTLIENNSAAGANPNPMENNATTLNPTVFNSVSSVDYTFEVDKIDDPASTPGSGCPPEMPILTVSIGNFRKTTGTVELLAGTADVINLDGMTLTSANNWQSTGGAGAEDPASMFFNNISSFPIRIRVTAPENFDTPRALFRAQTFRAVEATELCGSVVSAVNANGDDVPTEVITLR